MRPASMMRALSMDIRTRAMARLDAGETVRAVAEALSVAPSSVVKWSQRRRATGSAAPGKIGGHVPRKIRGEAADWLRARALESAPGRHRHPKACLHRRDLGQDQHGAAARLGDTRQAPDRPRPLRTLEQAVELIGPAAFGARVCFVAPACPGESRPGLVRQADTGETGLSCRRLRVAKGPVWIRAASETG